MLAQICRPKVVSCTSVLRLARSLNASSSTPKSNDKTRRVPLATDLDGISLDPSTGPGTRPRGFTPSRKDLGQTDVDQLLSVRLQRRLPGSQRQSQPPNPREQRPRQNLGATNPRPSAYKPTSAGPKKPRAGGGARKPNRPSRPVRGALTRTDQADASEPDVPLTPAVIPPRIYNLTYLSNLTSPSPSTTHTSQNSDPVQRVREKIGGDYSKWMSKEDIAAAGKDKDVSTIARARLALAFNPTITPQNRQKLVDTTQMLLNKGKPSGVVASS